MEEARQAAMHFLTSGGHCENLHCHSFQAIRLRPVKVCVCVSWQNVTFKTFLAHTLGRYTPFTLSLAASQTLAPMSAAALGCKRLRVRCRAAAGSCPIHTPACVSFRYDAGL